MPSNEDVYHLGIKALVQNVNGDILLLQVNVKKLSGNASAYWDLPGGRVQKGDTINDTLRREVEEEIGISDITDIQQIGMVLSNIRIPVDDDTVGLILGVYRCSIREECSVTLSDEHTDYGWFSPQDASIKLAVKYPADFCEQISNMSTSAK